MGGHSPKCPTGGTRKHGLPYCAHGSYGIALQRNMATKTETSPKAAPVEFEGVLPRWRDDDVTFLFHLLSEVYGRKLVTIAEVVKGLGFSHRSDDNKQPRSPEYYRIRRAFHAALAQGLVRRSGPKWGLL